MSAWSPTWPSSAAQLPISAVRGRCVITLGHSAFRLAGFDQADALLRLSVLPGGSGDVGRDDVGRVPVEGGAGTVVAHGGARVGVRGGFLHVAQRDSGVERGCDECVAQGVRPDGLGDPRPAGDPPDDPPGTMPVQPAAVCSQEDRVFGTLADGQVDRPRGTRASGMVTTLPPLRVTTRVRWPRSTPRASIRTPDKGRYPQPGAASGSDNA